MYYNNNEFPFQWENLPNVEELLDELDWDVVCIFDACRWDAFNRVCADSDPVASPVSVTFEWITDVWCNDDYDWSDVTYISGNPMTSEIADSDQFDGALKNHVANHVEVYDHDHGWNGALGTSLPGYLTDIASAHEPPIVVHYNQPHNPYIGDVKLNGTGNSADTALPIDEDVSTHASGQLVQQGHVSLEMFRAAYFENLKLVWEESSKLRADNRTITTADHGEALGPDNFSHGGPTNRGRTVPFHRNWDVTLPTPESVGASNDYEWSTETDTTNTESVTHRDPEQTREEKLQSLGYK